MANIWNGYENKMNLSRRLEAASLLTLVFIPALYWLGIEQRVCAMLWLGVLLVMCGAHASRVHYRKLLKDTHERNKHGPDTGSGRR